MRVRHRDLWGWVSLWEDRIHVGGGVPEGMGSATGTLKGVLEEKGVCMERGPTGYSPASWDLLRVHLHR